MDKSKLSDKLLSTVAYSLIFLGIIGIGYVLYNKFLNPKDAIVVGNTDCVEKTLQETMQDEHMSGLIEKNDKYSVLVDYYDCNPVQSGDIVWYQFSERIPAVPRRVVGLPKDKFEVVEDKDGRWNIKINDKLVMADANPYFIKSNSVPPLRTYQLSLNGILPKGKYILLSNVPPGLSDSSNLGLIEKKSLRGKINPTVPGTF